MNINRNEYKYRNECGYRMNMEIKQTDKDQNKECRVEMTDNEEKRKGGKEEK